MKTHPISKLVFAVFTGTVIICLAEVGQAQSRPDTVILENRNVKFTPISKSEAKDRRLVYIRCNRALTRSQLTSASAEGLRYLGVLTSHVYAFTTTDHSQRWWAFIQTQDNFQEIAYGEDVDRLEADVLPLYLSQTTLPHSLTVTFWPTTTVQEVLNLIPGAKHNNRLPNRPESGSWRRSLDQTELHRIQYPYSQAPNKLSPGGLHRIRPSQNSFQRRIQRLESCQRTCDGTLQFGW